MTKEQKENCKKDLIKSLKLKIADKKALIETELEIQKNSITQMLEEVEILELQRDALETHKL
mgnify:CR=1 FL=1